VLASIRSATKIYGQHKALNKVAFELAEGEVHCLVGENGAGKSTLTKILSGAITPDSGTIVLDGTEYRGFTPRQAIELGVSTVYQEPELIESLTVADNIYLGDERSAAFPLVVDTRTQNVRARDLIRSLHFNLKEDAVVEELSSAQKQMLQIAKARFRESRGAMSGHRDGRIESQRTRLDAFQAQAVLRHFESVPPETRTKTAPRRSTTMAS
jgi:ribose transport system ATP-binding protein